MPFNHWEYWWNGLVWAFQKNVSRPYYRTELLIELLYLLSSGSYLLTERLSQQVFTLEQQCWTIVRKLPKPGSWDCLVIITKSMFCILLHSPSQLSSEFNTSVITKCTWEARELRKCHFNFLASITIQEGILGRSWNRCQSDTQYELFMANRRK